MGSYIKPLFLFLILVVDECTTTHPHGDMIINRMLNIDIQSHYRPNSIAISGRLGSHMSQEDVLSAEFDHLHDGIAIAWPGRAHVTISNNMISKEHSVTCQDVSWVAEDCSVTLFEDCYSLGGIHWYGGAPIQDLTWPIETWDRELKPFVSGDAIGVDIEDNSLYAGVLERYWVNSNGTSFKVNSEVPLWLSLNSTGDQQICFRATYDESPYQNYDNSLLFLNYTICQATDVKEAQLYAIENYFAKPFNIPDEMLFRYPIYSTWARYHANITQELVIDFANEINFYNYSNAQMEIDDDWESEYGQLDFNLEKFPDPKAMVDELTNLGFRTTVWVHPFINVAPGNLWIDGMKDPGGVLPSLTMWWNGVASVVDFTADNDINQWMAKLMNLRDTYGVSSFKFDAGETNWMPAAYLPRESFRNPCDYTRLYMEQAYLADTDIRHQEVRAGYQTQHLPVFARLLDKYSQWGHDNGLRSIIPNVLLFSVIGYVFPLPDMIGGNAYDGFPDRELFIRWTELNVFLPGFQFSIVPWQFDDEVVEICRGMLNLHEQYADKMIELARNATVTGEPIVRPLWWIAPTDPVALEIDSEYLLGDDVLVAPIVYEGALSRDIYLPSGNWQDMNNPETILVGGQWYMDYPAPLHVLPYFTRM